MTIDKKHSYTGAEIMVVEDNPSDMKLLTDFLNEAGCQVRAASDGELALLSVKAKVPDIILLDVKLPDMNGVDVCQRIKVDPQTQNVPILFISALGETDLKVKALEGGGVDYITKPIEPAEVLARIDTHLSIFKLQQKLTSQSEQLKIEIEERKKTEKELQHYQEHLEALVEKRSAELLDREEKFKMLFESSFDGIAETNLDGQLVDCNAAYARMTGHSFDELKKLT